jgi:hypothetical protein
MAKSEAPNRVSVMFTLSPKAKQKLGRFKQRLREHGIAPSVASESAVVERLISEAAFDDILALFH